MIKIMLMITSYCGPERPKIIFNAFREGHFVPLQKFSHEICICKNVLITFFGCPYRASGTERCLNTAQVVDLSSAFLNTRATDQDRLRPS